MHYALGFYDLLEFKRVATCNGQAKQSRLPSSTRRKP